MLHLETHRGGIIFAQDKDGVTLQMHSFSIPFIFFSSFPSFLFSLIPFTFFLSFIHPSLLSSPSTYHNTHSILSFFSLVFFSTPIHQWPCQHSLFKPPFLLPCYFIPYLSFALCVALNKLLSLGLQDDSHSNKYRVQGPIKCASCKHRVVKSYRCIQRDGSPLHIIPLFSKEDADEMLRICRRCLKPGQAKSKA